MRSIRTPLATAALLLAMATPAAAISGNSGGGAIAIVIMIAVLGPLPWALLAGGFGGTRAHPTRPRVGAIVGVAAAGISMTILMLFALVMHDRPPATSLVEAVARTVVPAIPTIAVGVGILAVPFGAACAAVARAWPDAANQVTIASAAGVLLSLAGLSSRALGLVALVSAGGVLACAGIVAAALLTLVLPPPSPATTAPSTSLSR